MEKITLRITSLQNGASTAKCINDLCELFDLTRCEAMQIVFAAKREQVQVIETKTPYLPLYINEVLLNNGLNATQLC